MPSRKPKRKMTMAEFERSPEDRKTDKSGRHGKEGSAKDRRADAKALAKINRKRKTP